MKTKSLIVLIFLLYTFTNCSRARKNKKFLNGLIDLEMPFREGLKESAEESKLKLLKLYENFDENERMAKILEIFNDIKQNVLTDEGALTNTSAIVESINSEFTQYLKTNSIGENLNKSEIVLNLQTNLSALKQIKQSLTDALFHFRAKGI